MAPYKEIYNSDIFLRKCGRALPIYVFVTGKLLVQYYLRAIVSLSLWEWYISWWASSHRLKANYKYVRLCLKCGGTRPETGFLLSVKRTSQFKSAGASFQSTTGSQGVRIKRSNAGYSKFHGSVKGTGYPLHSPVSPFTSPPTRHRVPSHFNWALSKIMTLYKWFPNCDFPGDPWIHFCNGYFEVCLFFNSGDNILLKIIAELIELAMCLFSMRVRISN